MDNVYIPESRFPMMVSSPYLAVSHADHGGTSPPLSSPMNCHDLVVCSFRPLLGNTDTTPGNSEIMRDTFTRRE
jgi:hypothetical protein